MSDSKPVSPKSLTELFALLDHPLPKIKGGGSAEFTDDTETVVVIRDPGGVVAYLPTEDYLDILKWRDKEEGTVQISPPTPVTANALQPQGNRRQRRRQEALHRQINNRFRSMSEQGLPIKISIGPDGKPVIRVDLRAAKKAEEAKNAALKESLTFTGADLELEGSDVCHETVYDADGNIVSHRIVEED